MAQITLAPARAASRKGRRKPYLETLPALQSSRTEKQFKAEVRRIRQAKIKAKPWHAGLPLDERMPRIKADVNRWWHLEVKEATKRLLDQG